MSARKRVAPILVISGGLVLSAAPVVASVAVAAAPSVPAATHLYSAKPAANPDSFYHGSAKVTLTIKASPGSFYHG